MARTPGARNTGFTQQRAALVSKLKDRLAAKDGPTASLRELALAAGVSVATLRHYFINREGVVRAVLRGGRGVEEGQPTLTGQRGDSDVESSMHDSLQALALAWPRGIGTLHAVGLVEGLKSEAAGLSYLVDILEPTLQALERRLETHIERAEMREADTRHAALWLMAPILLALLHQNELGGRKCRPLDMGALVRQHARVFAVAYRPEQGSTDVNVCAW